MKRLWASAIILVLVITVCIFGSNKTKQISKDMTQTITSAKNAANGGDMNTALKLSEKAVTDWQDYHKTLCMYMPHDQLESIDQTLSALPMLSYYGTTDQFAADCDRSITQIKYLNESELASFENIF